MEGFSAKSGFPGVPELDGFEVGAGYPGVIRDSGVLIPTEGLGVWLDPSDLSTLFQDSAGTTPVTSDGDPIGLIQDKSGNANHATQSTALNKPTYKTDGTYHWLEFDGTNSFMTFASDFAGAVDSDNTLVSAARVTATGNRYLVGAEGDDGLGFLYLNGLIRPFVETTAGFVFGNGTTATTSTDRVVAMEWDRSAGAVKGWQNQALEVNASGTAADLRSTAPFTLGARGNLSSARMSGRAYGLAIYGLQLSDEDRNAVEAFMASKSGVSL